MSKFWSGQGRKGAPPSGRVLGKIIPNPKLKLLDQVREVMRLKHYSLRTERCYCDWIGRYIHFHKMLWREQLFQDPKARLREQVHEVARFKHLSLRTEETYWGWMVRYLNFHRKSA